MSSYDNTGDGIVTVRLREARQLFDAMDPSPFHEKELSRDAEDYLVESVKELPSGVLREIVFYIDDSQLVDGEAIGHAIRVHFARRSTLLRRALRRLLHRGFVSLIIALSFLFAMFEISQYSARLMGEHAAADVLREGLLIIGWVAMWKPLEILLYDWWPLVFERRLFDLLSRVQVRFVAESTRGPIGQRTHHGGV